MMCQCRPVVHRQVSEAAWPVAYNAYTPASDRSIISGNIQCNHVCNMKAIKIFPGLPEVFRCHLRSKVVYFLALGDYKDA